MGHFSIMPYAQRVRERWRRWASRRQLLWPTAFRGARVSCSAIVMRSRRSGCGRGGRQGRNGRMVVRFNAEIATTLAARARNTADELRGQGVLRQRCLIRMVLNFKGVAARLFGKATMAEEWDRSALAGVLDDLVRQVEKVTTEAKMENHRQRELEEWRCEEERLQRLGALAAADPLKALQDWGSTAQTLSSLLHELLTLKPSEQEIRPTPIRAEFSAAARVRATTDANPSGLSSADPVLLREYVGVIRAQDMDLTDYFYQLQGAWLDFQDQCPWAVIEEATFIGGFSVFVHENGADTDWLERVAEAFERAGGGELSNVALQAVSGSRLSTPLQHLLDPLLDSVDVVAAWNATGLTKDDIPALPLSIRLKLANLNGLPATLRDVASRSVLSTAVGTPTTPADALSVYRALGLTNGSLSFDDFKEQVKGLADGLRTAEEKAKDFLGDKTEKVVQLVGFGVDDGGLVAAVSLGNLDTADNVTVNVPGMDTTLKSTAGNVQAANDLLNAAYAVNKKASSAVVAWLGYRAPGFLEVGAGERSTSGGIRLASFIDGVYDSRRDAAPKEFTVAAHSYGSPTVADALRSTRHRISNFISYGSAGFESHETPATLHVDHVFATEANADFIADIGRLASGRSRTDPRAISGVTTFSSEAGDGTKAVTGHDMSPDESGGDVGYLSPDSTSLQHIARILITGAP
ncbi:hypothetical protein C5D47_01575 [Rathayibacter toxicus]|uniref:DUF1023 domain-containing protein n=2 Tax=Rathayibacter toxicus TaxID=145458 RepID=A0A2S5Y886_9MICO|nr:hypothetical protein C5D17_01540 [Rathayibacter toxicus]PPH58623.1 hypothetical protein C5D30_01550 [Rathayibacter toxicus]PPH60615.1 hypothetical protein C5C93_01575 [Rathayibacter toxicus]PPH88435.1 hypothetical protein C5D31_01550 [Rathayibacter toxicus]PPI16129.1 hypothetical protein C5C51_01545 [Rathayibacter toxicus]